MADRRALQHPSLGAEALRGIRVLSFAQLLVGPRCVQLLADLGADVIKVERPGRGAWERQNSSANCFLQGESVFFLSVNRNQRSLTLDLKHPRGIAIARQLASRADVLVENYRPGVLERLGLGYEQLREANPGLIYASAYGYGSSGPYRNKPGQDLLAQALGGLTWLTGRRSDPPMPVGFPVADVHTGTLLTLAILVALFHRERMGVGQQVEVDLLSAVLDLQMEPAAYHLNCGDLSRSEAGIATPFHQGPYGIYRTLDGYLALSLTDLAELGRLLGLRELEDERFTRPGAAFELRDQIYRLVSAVMGERSTQDWLGILEAHDVWCAAVRNYDEVFSDPQIKENQMVIEVDHPRLGRLRFTGIPMRFGVTPASLRRPPPELGEHSDEILRELGYTAADIQGFRQDGVV